MARWSLFEKRDVESLSRVLSARTLDGYKIRAKLAVNFTRLLSEAETEALAQAYAEVFRSAVEVEICEGRMPFDDVSLHRLLTERVQEVPAHRVRVNGAHLVSPGSASSTSMPVVRAPLADPSSARTLPPLRHPSELPRSQAPSSRSPSSAGQVPVRRTVSGIMPSDEGSRRFSDSPFVRVAAAAQAAESLPGLSDELARGLRHAAGSLLLTALRENASQLTDPLAVLDGSLEPATLSGLVQEACVAMAYVLHRALALTDFTEKQAIAVVQAATCVALRNGELPVADMSRYFATDMPADEFHRASCRLLGILGTDAAEQAISGLVERLAQDALACATSLQGCLRRVG